MINILGICGSPVEGSSTQILIDEILRGAGSHGATTDNIILNNLQIKPCQACGESPEVGYCIIDDDMTEVYRKFDLCDAIVVGSPIYFDSVSAQTKLFVDRTNCFRAMTPDRPQKFVMRITKKRKGAVVLVGGKQKEFEPARLVIGGFFVWAGIEPMGMITYTYDGFEKGTVGQQNEILKKAFDLGIKLVS